MILGRIFGKRAQTPSDRESESLRVFELTWAIPSEFGGMTSVMLRRARNFAQLQNLPIDILTLDYKMDLAEVETRLRDSQELVDGVRIRNLWQEFAQYSDRQLSALGASSAGAGIPAGVNADSKRVTPRFVEYFDADKSVLRIDHFREDGSIFLTDDRDGGKRRLILVGRRGKYVGEFSRARDLYFSWLDVVTDRHSSVIISESKFVGSFLHHFERPKVKVGQVLHNTHIEPRSSSVFGRFTASRVGILSNWTKFDFLVFLTHRQRDDFIQAFGNSPGLFVIPNCTAVEAEVADDSGFRNIDSGAVVARLAGQKQIDHAIKAIGAVEEEVTLDIYGDGELRVELESQVSADARLTDRVRFKGFSSDAAEGLERYSFILLTSSYEGFGLVLIEAMSHGCIPIAYDIRYGPSEVIDHEVNGFLTDSVEGVTSAIERLIRMDPAEIAKLRTAARSKALTFNDENITRKWMQLFADVESIRRDAADHDLEKVTVGRVEHADSCLNFTLSVKGETSQDRRGDRLVLASRDKRFSIACTVGDGSVASVPTASILSVDSNVTFDAWYQHWNGGRVERLRVAHSIGGGDIVEPNMKIYPTIHGNLSVQTWKNAQ